MNNSVCDIALIHPPHIFNTEKYAVFPLPWNLSHIGSTTYIGKYPIGPDWDIMPLGFPTMKNFIEDNSDYTVSIINLALLKSEVPKDIFDKFKHIHNKDASILKDLAEAMYPRRVVSAIKKLKADLFAVDLHWLNFSQGAIQTLKLLKEIHPHSYTVIGGFTASYFKHEIMKKFSFIDFLIAGDGCVPLLKLIEQIRGNKDFFKVPNLLYRTKGEVRKSHRRRLNDFEIVQNDAKLCSPISAARGCPLKCVTCGGSKYSFENLHNYGKIRAYSVKSVMKKLFNLTGRSVEKQQTFLIHDPFLTMGMKNWNILLDEIKKNKLNVRFTIEFFLPHRKKDIIKIAEVLPGSSIHISPESIDADARSFHKNLRYSNRDLIMNMDVINNTDSLSMGVWFMAGLAKDTKQGIDETLSFIKSYYNRMTKKENNFIQFNELLFLDPGSLAFDFPKKYGYRLINKSFLSHMESFKAPIFKHQINYRTEYLTRDQIFDIFLYVHNKMNKMYYENNVINKRLYDRVSLYNALLEKYSPEYDNALTEKDNIIRNKRYEKIGNVFRSELEK